MALGRQTRKGAKHKKHIRLEKHGFTEKLKLFLPWERGLPLWVRKNVTYPTYLKLKRLRVLEFLKELEISQWYDVEEMQALQLRKLKTLLLHCQTCVPYYQKVFNRLGFKPEDLEVLDDIQLLPFLEKEDFVRNGEDIKAVGKNFQSFTVQTSGSTGIPLSVLTDHNMVAYNFASRLRAKKWWNLNYGSKQATFGWRPFGKRSLRLRMTDLLFRNNIVFSGLDLRREIMYEHYKKLVRFKPDVIYGNPSVVQILGRFIKENKLDTSMLGTKAVISTEEILHEYQREFIHSIFKCPVINEYGATESGIIAFECTNHNMHLMTDNLIIEIVKDGKPLDSGEFGEIVITNLNNYVMPIIRYRIGDVGRFIANECSCGVKLPLLDLAIGRDCDKIVLEDRELPGAVLFGYLGVHFNELIKVSSGGLEAFKVFQKSLNQFKFQYVLKDEDLRDRIEQETKRVVRNVLGAQIQLEFEYVENIPRDESRKSRYFVSEVLE